MPFRQSTIAESIEFGGVGVHSGVETSLTIYPAEVDTGLVFVRGDIDEEVEIPALLRSVCATEMCTAIGSPSGAAVSTVEHLIAALGGLGIDNALIEIDGAEVPILDGSAAPFVDAIRQSGIHTQKAPRRFVKIVKPIRVESGRSFGELIPYDGFAIDVTIEFASSLIGTQRIALDVTPTSFIAELARARTFGFVSEVERLWACGYAMGASLDNTVVLGEGQIMNPEGLRWADEFVRHKALDAVGDLALAGAPILGRYRSVRGGHHLNYQVLRALAADRDAWTWVEGGTRRAARGHAELAPGVALPAFGPDLS
jgi:UDP-3-O-[3-hydroxymyristoyl] N-acetylglucosamine deacetylase